MIPYHYPLLERAPWQQVSLAKSASRGRPEDRPLLLQEHIVLAHPRVAEYLLSTHVLGASTNSRVPGILASRRESPRTNRIAL